MNSDDDGPEISCTDIRRDSRLVHNVTLAPASRRVVTLLCERLCVRVDEHPSERRRWIGLKFYSSILNVVVLRVRPIRIPPTRVCLDDVIGMEANAKPNAEQLIEATRDCVCGRSFPKATGMQERGRVLERK